MKNIDIIFAGDFAPCGAYEQMVLNGKELFSSEAFSVLSDADIAFANLECPLTKCNRPIKKSGPALKANPDCVAALAPFSVVGLANNHIFDYGKEGVEDTILACQEAELPTVGAGLTQGDANAPWMCEVGGMKVAIIAVAEHEFNQAESGGIGSAVVDPIKNYWQVKTALDSGAVVIVTLHGGNEHFPFPRPGLRALCQFFIELGVEAVVCHHAHVPGAYEYYRGKPIIYSLGNLIFDHPKAPQDWNRGYMARITIDHREKVCASLELIPYVQSVGGSGVALLRAGEKAEFLAVIEKYRRTMSDSSAWEREWDSFVETKCDTYILHHFSPFSVRGLGFLARNTPVARLFLSRKNSLKKLNMLRCDSHRELLTDAVEFRTFPKDRNQAALSNTQP